MNVNLRRIYLLLKKSSSEILLLLLLLLSRFPAPVPLCATPERAAANNSNKRVVPETSGMVNSLPAVHFLTAPEGSPGLPGRSWSCGTCSGGERTFYFHSTRVSLHPGAGSRPEGTRQRPGCLQTFSLRNSR